LRKGPVLCLSDPTWSLRQTPVVTMEKSISDGSIIKRRWGQLKKTQGLSRIKASSPRVLPVLPLIVPLSQTISQVGIRSFRIGHSTLDLRIVFLCRSCRKL
jgi:hypothetical protein